MKKWIASAGIFAAISMGLIACGDNSSSAESSSRPGSNDYCKVVSTDPFLIESVENGYFSQTGGVRRCNCRPNGLRFV